MRYVKFGRHIDNGGPLVQHWAVKVGDTWYEICEKKYYGGSNKVERYEKFEPNNGADSPDRVLIVGKTEKTDEKIDKWIEVWLSGSPEYPTLSKTSKTFAYASMYWLTDGNFIFDHRFNDGHTYGVPIRNIMFGNTKRYVKFGRRPIKNLPLIQHWAVNVGDTWYEIGGKKINQGDNEVDRYYGFSAKSGAGFLGGELVGKTNKTDSEIYLWIDIWLLNYPIYGTFSKNCQKFAYELMHWLTDGNLICDHRFNAGDTSGVPAYAGGTFAGASGGNAIARAGVSEVKGSYSVLNGSAKGPEVKVQAVAGPGVGVWADASLGKAEGTIGNLVGVHLEPNINTGIGARNGNLDVHLLGFGGKIGADGVQVDTPLGGVNACCLM